MKTLSEVVDELNIAHNYVECAFLASHQASDEVMHPLCAVLDAATTKLEEIQAALDVIKMEPAYDKSSGSNAGS